MPEAGHSVTLLHLEQPLAPPTFDQHRVEAGCCERWGTDLSTSRSSTVYQLLLYIFICICMCSCMCICVRLRLHQRRQVRLVGWQGQHCPSPGSSQEPAFSGAQAVLCLILAPTYLAAWLLQPPTDESDDHFPPRCFPISHLASTTKSACPSRPVIFLLVVFFLIINYLASWTDFGLYIYIWCRLFLR